MQRLFQRGLLVLVLPVAACAKDVKFDAPGSGGAGSGGAAVGGRSGAGGSGSNSEDGGGTSEGTGGEAGQSGGSSGSGGRSSGGGLGGEVSGSGGAPSPGAGGGASGGSNACWELGEFFDDFTDAEHTESCWKTYNSSALVAGSSDQGYSLDPTWGLLLRPKSGPIWAGENAGFLLFQEITGNFRLEVQVWVMSAGAGEEAPTTRQTFAGLLVHPGSLPEAGAAASEYYAIKVGRFVDTAGIRAEIQQAGAVPRYVDEQDDSAWENTFLRICRVGNQVWTAYLPSGETAWRPLHENNQSLGYDTRDDAFPDLPERVSVGILGEVGDIGASDGSARITVGSAGFDVPSTLEGCGFQF